MTLIGSFFKKGKSKDTEKDEVKENKLEEKDEKPAAPAAVKEEAEETSARSAPTRRKISAEKEKTGYSHPMVKIIEASKNPPEEGDLVEGPVIDIEKSSLFIDLGPFGTGIIYGREFMNASDIIKKMNVGDTITAKVVDIGNEDGYIELSLKEARQAIVWGEAEEIIKKKGLLELPVKEANKGGLILEWQGIQGFLPASQLKAEHYPRVSDGDKDKIFQELQKFIGKKLQVTILSVIPKEGKLIFSEKVQEEKGKGELVAKYKVGDVVEGEVTGIVDFGLFVKIEDGLEGLVHISEMDWGLVENPRALFKVGERVHAQIIEIKDDKVSLSIKALKQNPWTAAKDKYKKGDTIKGVVIRHNRHGALVSIEEGVAGLVHISEFGTDKVLKETLELGKTYSFTITLFDPAEQRMTLSYKESHGGSEPKKETAEA
ncbi:MAG: S1 RNA-binding domain-containing protein [Patescibacteria group bacterium]